MTDALDSLVALLDLEPIEENIFRGQSPKEERMRIFGGQVAGQALVAAGRTVEKGQGGTLANAGVGGVPPNARASAQMTVHSLHAYFLRPGDPSVPILYEVDRIRDGRSFTTRRVVAIQHGQAIFNLSASFHVEERGLEHQTLTMGDPADPESLPTVQELLAPVRDRVPDWYWARPIDIRWVEGVPWLLRTEKRPPHQRMWIRADGRLPDDPLLHACIVAYASDMSLLDTGLMPHGLTWSTPGVMGASLDHAMWFHRPFRADEWLLYDQESTTASDARAFSRGSIFTRDGRLAVTVVQEGLLRVPL
jgi:acyl-CoA thioesterase-2